MFRIVLASLLVVGLLAAGCTTEKPNHIHHGCHSSAHRAGRSGNATIHHHYAKPDAQAETKTAK